MKRPHPPGTYHRSLEDLSIHYLGTRIIGQVLSEKVLERVGRRTRSTIDPKDLTSRQVHVWSNGTFTIAIFDNEGYHIGVAKRHPKDTLRITAGIAIATRRALQTYLSSRYLI